MLLKCLLLWYVHQTIGIHSTVHRIRLYNLGRTVSASVCKDAPSPPRSWTSWKCIFWSRWPNGRAVVFGVEPFPPRSRTSRLNFSVAKVWKWQLLVARVWTYQIWVAMFWSRHLCFGATVATDHHGRKSLEVPCFGRQSLDMPNFGLESLDMPKFCREKMDMSLGPRPAKTAQKPLKSCVKNRSKITARNERFLSGFWAVF